MDVSPGPGLLTLTFFKPGGGSSSGALCLHAVLWSGSWPGPAASSTSLALPSCAEKFNSGAGEAGMGRPGSTGRFPPARRPELLVTPGPAAQVPNLVLREGPQGGSWTALAPVQSEAVRAPPGRQVGRPSLGFTFGGLTSFGAQGESGRRKGPVSWSAGNLGLGGGGQLSSSCFWLGETEAPRQGCWGSRAATEPEPRLGRGQGRE